ncbi:MAG: hypothetical protein V1744_01630, partial [Candidatus Altiarchaeota archaeon]
DGDLLSTTPYNNVEKGLRENVLKPPAGPTTVLNDNVQEHSLSDESKTLKIDVNYTIRNELRRQPIVEQCSWIGCSRIEELVINYTQTICLEQCDGTYGDCTDTPKFSGEIPCCCWDDPGNSDPGSWPCPQFPNNIYERLCCGSMECSDPACESVCFPKLLKKKEKHDCNCEYACWGCWHMGGETLDYPVTKTNPDTEEEEIVYEEINDTSTVVSKPYGDHLTIENPADNDVSEVTVNITGRIYYNYSGAPTFTAGYITFKSNVSDKKGDIDVFSGFKLDVPDVAVLEFSAKKYPSIHDMTVLESTLPREYMIVQTKPETTTLLLPDSNRLPYLLNMTRHCYTDWFSQYADSEDSLEPLYFRWLRNPVKKFYYTFDSYTATATKYSWATPIILTDRSRTGAGGVFVVDDPFCTNYFSDPAYNIGLYRNFHEDEPRYYDYTGVYMNPLDVEQGLEVKNFNPDKLENVKMTKRSKSINSAYVRYAPDCKSRPYDQAKLSCFGNLVGLCPDMCTEVAQKICNDGVCDCNYTKEYERTYPLVNDTCNGVKDWKVSPLARCEGAPGVYKSFCSDGVFHAYWADVFQYKYKWNSSINSCDLQYIKNCTPENITTQSYTLIFESNSLDKSDWDKANLTVYHNLRSASMNPLGAGSPCAEDEHEINAGGITLKVEKPHPKKYFFEEDYDVGSKKFKFTVKEMDLCNGDVLDSGAKKLYIEFSEPYSDHTGWYSTGSVLDVKDRQQDINYKFQSYDGLHTDKGNSGRTLSKSTNPMCDYLMNNLWFLLVAFFAVMSYRFFSGKAMDFKDMYDEFKGKK